MVQGSYVDVVKRDAGCGVNLTMFGGRACARLLNVVQSLYRWTDGSKRNGRIWTSELWDGSKRR